jgi:hypothetical protein
MSSLLVDELWMNSRDSMYGLYILYSLPPRQNSLALPIVMVLASFVMSGLRPGCDRDLSTTMTGWDAK